MTRVSLTDYFWENLNSIRLNVELLETYTLQTSRETHNKFNSAFKNLKKRKRFNKRTMNPLVCKIKKDLDEFLKTTECKDYFMNCALVPSINGEEVGREIFKSSVKAANYSEKTRGIKRQRLNNDEEEVEEEEEEEEEAVEGDDRSSSYHQLPSQLQAQPHSQSLPQSVSQVEQWIRYSI